MNTTAIVVYCPRCDYFKKTAVQSSAIGSHGCAQCGELMEVYVAQGREQGMTMHGAEAKDRGV